MEPTEPVTSTEQPPAPETAPAAETTPSLEVVPTPPFKIEPGSPLGRLENISANLRLKLEKLRGGSKKIRTEGQPTGPKAAEAISILEELKGEEKAPNASVALDALRGGNVGNALMAPWITAGEVGQSNVSTGLGISGNQ